MDFSCHSYQFCSQIDNIQGKENKGQLSCPHNAGLLNILQQ